ncbi:MAG: T9SS type A sorting domain-containing protein [Ignavibacteriales bacterium]|nr:T9SS type A sorting domain-containing protein [Ignavibacteriales bacterium]
MFRVNMSMQMRRGFFHNTDTLVVRGDFQIDAGDSIIWKGNRFILADVDGDSVYTLSVVFPDSRAGKTYNFKFVMHEVWEPTQNHTFTLENVLTQNLPVYYFANDSTAKTMVTNSIRFTADLGDIYGTGMGVFDPNQDSILVYGLDWENLGTIISGERKLMEVLSPAKRFRTTLRVKGPLGDSTKWKFRALPETRFRDSGWETGSDRWHVYNTDSVGTVFLPEIKPRITPYVPPTTIPITCRFLINMGLHPLNRYNREPIPVDQIEFVGIKGGDPAIGNWGGNWTVSDTTGPNPTLILLNDKGLDGDLTANDKTWSRNVLFPVGSNTRKIEYKFGCMYPGADTVNGGFEPLDNEAGYGLNHWVQLSNSNPSISSNQYWWLQPVEKTETAFDCFTISQNYPNPFNPTTKFTYSIPVDAHVNLTLYNIMGEKVLTIFDGFQHASAYEAVIDGSQLSSGVYFCKLRSSSYYGTIKMVLMK